MFNQHDVNQFREGLNPLSRGLVSLGLDELLAFLEQKQKESRRWNLWQRIVLGALIGAVKTLRAGLGDG